MPEGLFKIPDHKSASGKEWVDRRGGGLERIENVGPSAVITETESAANDGQACRRTRPGSAQLWYSSTAPTKSNDEKAEITSRDD